MFVSHLKFPNQYNQNNVHNMGNGRTFFGRKYFYESWIVYIYICTKRVCKVKRLSFQRVSNKLIRMCRCFTALSRNWVHFWSKNGQKASCIDVNKKWTTRCFSGFLQSLWSWLFHLFNACLSDAIITKWHGFECSLSRHIVSEKILTMAIS